MTDTYTVTRGKLRGETTSCKICWGFGMKYSRPNHFHNRCEEHIKYCIDTWQDPRSILLLMHPKHEEMIDRLISESK